MNTQNINEKRILLILDERQKMNNRYSLNYWKDNYDKITNMHHINKNPNFNYDNLYKEGINDEKLEFYMLNAIKNCQEIGEISYGLWKEYLEIFMYALQDGFNRDKDKCSRHSINSQLLISDLICTNVTLGSTEEKEKYAKDLCTNSLNVYRILYEVNDVDEIIESLKKETSKLSTEYYLWKINYNAFGVLLSTGLISGKDLNYITLSLLTTKIKTPQEDSSYSEEIINQWKNDKYKLSLHSLLISTLNDSDYKTDNIKK